jgi:transposase InsO family protein
MDFISNLPLVSNKSTIWVIVDRLTKFAHFIALPNGITAVALASTFLAEINRLHGLPKTIVSDRDKLFISKFWKELFTRLGTSLAFSSSYHPQTDGQTEVLNRCLETYSRCFVSEEPHHWPWFLPLAEFWYNSLFHSAIGMTPFEALYGTLDELLTKR